MYGCLYQITVMKNCWKACPYSSSCLPPLLPLVTSDIGGCRLVILDPKRERTSPFQDEDEDDVVAQWCDFSPLLVTSGMSCMQLLILRPLSYPYQTKQGSNRHHCSVFSGKSNIHAPMSLKCLLYNCFFACHFSSLSAMAGVLVMTVSIV